MNFYELLEYKNHMGLEQLEKNWIFIYWLMNYFMNFFVIILLFQTSMTFFLLCNTKYFFYEF